MKLKSERCKEVQEGLGLVGCLDPLSFGSGEVKNISTFLKQRQVSEILGIPVLRSSALQSHSLLSIRSVFVFMASLIFNNPVTLWEQSF